MIADTQKIKKKQELNTPAAAAAVHLVTNNV
jgi:hypothetical protein